MKLMANLTTDAIIRYYEQRYGQAYDDYQIEQLKRGYRKVNIDLYADPAYNWWNMAFIRHCLELDLDVTHLLNPKLGFGHIDLLARGLEEGLDISACTDPSLKEREVGKMIDALVRQSNKTLDLTRHRTIRDHEVCE